MYIQIKTVLKKQFFLQIKNFIISNTVKHLKNCFSTNQDFNIIAVCWLKDE